MELLPTREKFVWVRLTQKNWIMKYKANLSIMFKWTVFQNIVLQACTRCSLLRTATD